MIAAHQTVKMQNAREVIFALPVASPNRLGVRRCWEDEVCLLASEEFWAIRQHYEDITQIEDEDVTQLVGEFAPPAGRRQPAVRSAEVPTGAAGTASEASD